MSIYFQPWARYNYNHKRQGDLQKIAISLLNTHPDKQAKSATSIACFVFNGPKMREKDHRAKTQLFVLSTTAQEKS